MEPQGTLNCKKKKKRKEKKKNGRLTLFDFKTYYKAVVIKIILA